MRVLVTGASGMLGAGVARTLAERGNSVTVLQRRPSGLGLNEVLSDVADTAAVQRALTGHDAVIHLAAKVNVTGPEREYSRINVDGTRAVIDGCRRAGVGRLVYVSSPSVSHSGRALIGVGAASADPAGARGPYSKTKAIAEQLALQADSGSLAVVAVRPHLVWGPGDGQLVARVVERARQGRLPVIGSGAAMVDTTYVSNAVDALAAALDRCDQVHGQALVVSNGEPRPIVELIGAICDAAGVPRPAHRVPVRLAAAIGSAVQAAWAVGDHLHPERHGADPPITRFLVEQISTAHWFDQRHTRYMLQWQPRISLDEGFGELRRYYDGLRDLDRHAAQHG
jgi:2-alkyl-3-oxoalkanoate reductase